ncbi:MAG: hypothetical protein ACTS3R_13415 [Inquilinaceae bacterium]
MRGPQIASIVLAASLALTACGSSLPDRTYGGAGVGAGTGAAVGVLFGGVGVIPGAIVGALAGGTTGAVTSEDEIDLGDPVWR